MSKNFWQYLALFYFLVSSVFAPYVRYVIYTLVLLGHGLICTLIFLDTEEDRG
ncbi:MAG: hypothetical protein NWE89_10525 [Candidatus Bathyarchaeota archaeon]|nr:hypothetical protein [Candidatus Bathyarchaeota archaeon]